MIEIKEVSKKFDENIILKNINIQIKKGDFFTIFGKSGSGKTTLLNIIGMIETFDSGNLTIDDINIKNNLSNKKEIETLRQKKISYLFQNFGLLENKSIFENLKIPYEFKKISKQNLKNKMQGKLKLVKLNKKLDEKIFTLSGGEQQRVALARALMKEPEIIFADEPTGSLDKETAQEIINLFVKINIENKTTIIMVTHDENIKKISNNTISLWKEVKWKNYLS